LLQKDHQVLLKIQIDISALFENTEYNALTIGPVTIELDLNETGLSEVNKVEYYINNELKHNITEEHIFVFNEFAFGIYTIKVVAYGQSEVVTQEMNVFMINFGLNYSMQES